MKIGTFIQNPFNEHLVLIRNPNKEIKTLPYIYIFGKKMNQKAFSMMEFRFQSENTE